MSETPERRWMRWAAATMAVAAGAIHAAQVRVHTDEDPAFGVFFALVATLQVLGGVYIARPVGSATVMRRVLGLGIGGSLATIAIWAVSRTFGLPFGAEPGEAEEVGLADAAANILEVFTAALLFLWLRAERIARRSWGRWTLGTAGIALGLATLWVALRALEILDPDPRLVLGPGLADIAALGLLGVVALSLVRLAMWRGGQGNAPGRIAVVGSLASLVVLELALVAFTVPARGGQNIECRYAPVAEDSGIAHARLPRPIAMNVGERRSIVVLLLTVCDVAVELVDAVPLRDLGDVLRIASVSVDRTRSYRAERVRLASSASSVPLRRVVMRPGEGRYPVTIEVEALRDGEVAIGAFRVEYVSQGIRGSFGFASFTRFCVGGVRCEAPP